MHRTIVKAGLGLVLLGFLTATYGAGESKPVNAAMYRQPIRLACIGDSITAGGSYVGELGTFLGKKWEVTNLGVSGATLLKKGDKPYNRLGQYGQALQLKPDVVTIALGTNDSKPGNWNNKAEFETDYKSMITDLKKANRKAIIYCCLPPPAGGNKWSINGATIKDEVIPMIRKVAKDTNCYVINLYEALDGKGGIADGVHPNGVGHKLIAESIYKALIGKAMPAVPPKDLAVREK